MNYYLDTEFLEGTQKSFFGTSKPTIDLISIGIVAEDGREYYAISKDFNLKEAWNRCDVKVWHNTDWQDNKTTTVEKVYWIRDNVLKPIWKDWTKTNLNSLYEFNYKNFKSFLSIYGKTNKQIAEEVKEFCSKHLLCNLLTDKKGNPINQIEADVTPKKFYGYYADYDWVVFCWLFGKMIDLPNGFPMYCIDLNQELDKYIDTMTSNEYAVWEENIYGINNYTPLKPLQENKLNIVKRHKDYPKEPNNHHALEDARWTKQLHQFLKSL